MSKLCKKCNLVIPRKIIIDGKERNLQNRKFCITCSPFGEHNTRDVTKEKSNVSSAAAVTKYRQRLKQKLIEYKGSKCIICGYDKPISRVYEFHHRNPLDKSFGISNNLCKSFKELKKEVDKCDLLCCRCHAELHHDLQQQK
jgi:hypothetical protein